LNVPEYTVVRRRQWEVYSLESVRSPNPGIPYLTEEMEIYVFVELQYVFICFCGVAVCVYKFFDVAVCVCMFL
jgi:hypothetical protein